jgi:hypothetical protein
MQFLRGNQSTTSRPRSVAGVASALAVLLAFPAAVLGEVLGLDSSMTLHLFLGIGMLFLAARRSSSTCRPGWPGSAASVPRASA